MRLSVAVVVSCITAIGFAAAADVQAAIRKSTNIPAQGLGPALQILAKDRGFQVIYVSNEVNSLRTQGASGELTSDEALTQLLNGTGLTYRYFGDNAVGIVSTASLAPVPEKVRKTSSSFEKIGGRWEAESFRLAAAGGAEEASSSEGRETSQSSKGPGDRVELEEIVVTGTHIRGGDSPAPVFTYSKDAIRLSGAATLQQFISKLPQNFGGGAADSTAIGSTGSGQVINRSSGTGVNLRGLGNDSTLVLLNGRRVAPGGTIGNFVDVSMIPLSAIERVEVLPDGASAIYGSDAVGGVINFILDRDFNGAETSGRYGSVTGGDSDEYQVGQTFGHHWNGGNGLLSYEYYKRTPLDSEDRSYTRSLNDPFNLLPKQQRQTVFASLQQNISSSVELFADGSFAKRSSYVDNAFVPGLSQRNGADTDSFTSAVGLRGTAFSDAQYEASVAYSGSDTEATVLRNATQLLVSERGRTDILSAELKLDGTLVQLPAGPASFAVGAQYRDESLETKNRLTSAKFEPSRDVIAGFLEFRVPLVSAIDGAAAPNRLELQLAGRYERYSDFGTSTNPRVGLSWRPLSDLKFRGTYGTSFKAPLLKDLNPRPAQVAPRGIFDPLGGSAPCNPPFVGNNCTATLLIFGGNPDLTAEKARTWTAGIDWEPDSVEGLKASATYYDIHFKDRITDPQFAIIFIDALRQEAVLGPEIIQRSPSLALVQSLYADPALANFFNIPASAVTAIADYRIHNLGSVDTSGVDLSVDYSKTLGAGTLQVGVDGTYILDFDTQFTETSPTVAVVNTAYNPVDLRLRGHAMFDSGPITAAVFINYVDSYVDTRGGTHIPIDSWTTADASVTYRPLVGEGFLHGLSLTLGVNNVTNEDPPIVANPSVLGLNYDGANASPLGRVLYLAFSKRWGK